MEALGWADIGRLSLMFGLLSLFAAVVAHKWTCACVAGGAVDNTATGLAIYAALLMFPVPLLCAILDHLANHIRGAWL